MARPAQELRPERRQRADPCHRRVADARLPSPGADPGARNPVYNSWMTQGFGSSVSGSGRNPVYESKVAFCGVRTLDLIASALRVGLAQVRARWPDGSRHWRPRTNRAAHCHKELLKAGVKLRIGHSVLLFVGVRAPGKLEVPVKPDPAPTSQESIDVQIISSAGAPRKSLKFEVTFPEGVERTGQTSSRSFVPSAKAAGARARGERTPGRAVSVNFCAAPRSPRCRYSSLSWICSMTIGQRHDRSLASLYGLMEFAVRIGVDLKC